MWFDPVDVERGISLRCGDAISMSPQLALMVPSDEEEDEEGMEWNNGRDETWFVYSKQITTYSEVVGQEIKSAENEKEDEEGFN